MRGFTTSSQLVENSNPYQALIHTDIFDPAKAGNETGGLSCSKTIPLPGMVLFPDS
jgi:hypothetical protein